MTAFAELLADPLNYIQAPIAALEPNPFAEDVMYDEASARVNELEGPNSPDYDRIHDAVLDALYAQFFTAAYAAYNK